MQHSTSQVPFNNSNIRIICGILQGKTAMIILDKNFMIERVY